MKLIFLDIDGVLNSASGKEPYISDMEAEKLKLLKRLIDESGSSGVVITSDRRYSKIDMEHKTEAFDQFEIYIVGETRRPNQDDLEDNRGKQIVDYLSSSKEDIERIVILDDNDDGISNFFEEEFILVNHYYGLNEEVYRRALNILN
ncbi:MAG: hypothetical protein J6N95_00840 [Bacilli bacterium]|nr:hypothetical protein [Bacilli bacterium]